MVSVRVISQIFFSWKYISIFRHFQIYDGIRNNACSYTVMNSLGGNSWDLLIVYQQEIYKRGMIFMRECLKFITRIKSNDHSMWNYMDVAKVILWKNKLSGKQYFNLLFGLKKPSKQERGHKTNWKTTSHHLVIISTCTWHLYVDTGKYIHYSV